MTRPWCKYMGMKTASLLIAALVVILCQAHAAPPLSSAPAQTNLLFIDTSFENASPVWHETANDGVIRVHLLYDHERAAPNRAAGHLHICLNAIPGSRLTLEFCNLDNIWNGRHGSVAREMRSLVISDDGLNWRGIPTTLMPTNRVQVTLDMPGPQLYIARVEPYRLSDLERFLTPLRSHPLATIETIGKSRQGRALELISFGPADAPHSIFLRARAHPWESGGNWVTHGLVRRLLAGDAAVSRLLARCRILLLPMANPDGVARGGTRFNPAGMDLNRNWNLPADPELAPENAALEHWMAARISDGKAPLLAIDLHNDGYGKLHLSRPEIPDLAGHLERMRQLENLLRAHTWFTEGATTAAFRNPGSFGDGWLERFGVDAVVLELHCNWSAGLSEIPLGRHWEAFGAGLVDVFDAYVPSAAP